MNNINGKNNVSPYRLCGVHTIYADYRRRMGGGGRIIIYRVYENSKLDKL